MMGLCVSGLFLLSFPAAAQSLAEKIDRAVQACDSLGGFNGVIVVGLGPDAVQTFTYGYKNPADPKEHITEEDRFDLASLTKQFTGLAVLREMEKGTLRADDPIGKYLPELQPALQKVTIRQLANHTNGIHDFYSLTTRHDTLDRKTILAMLTQLDTTVFEPGSRWGYSNSGYFLLSEIVERITGKTFSAYCTNHVLLPLGMETACFGIQGQSVLTGYSENGKPVSRQALYSGESGIYASAKDMIAYYQTVCRNSEPWHRYFSEMYKASDPSNTEHWNYGFGWYFAEDRLGPFRAHSGRNPGAHAYIRWYDDVPVFFCVLSNKKSDSIFNALRDQIAELILEEEN